MPWSSPSALSCSASDLAQPRRTEGAAVRLARVMASGALALTLLAGVGARTDTSNRIRAHGGGAAATCSRKLCSTSWPPASRTVRITDTSAAS